MCRSEQSLAVCQPVPAAGGNCCCNLSSLVILILIVLQFSKKGSHEGKFDNGILFIIALFYLSCCNPCKSMMC
jgi:hypothetical protein